MPYAHTWSHAARAGAARTPTILIVATATVLLLAALAAPAASTTATDPGSDRGASRAPVAPVAADSAVRSAPTTRSVTAPRRGHRFALPPDLRASLVHLLEIVGHDADGRLEPDDVVRGAAELGVDVDRPITPSDVETMLAAHRRHAVRPLAAIGIDVGSDPDHADLRRAAERIDVTVGGDAVTPRQVERVIRTANDRPTAVFATTAGIPVHTPTRHLRLIGFHQASFAAARQLSAGERVPTRTLPSRGRSTGSRSAADVSMTNGRAVIAPVTGRVVEVQHYALYGRYADARVRIVPDANPTMLVTVLHVTDPTVRVGSRVQGGKHTIARSATKFPFVSQIDRVAGDHPHVHIEVRRR